MAEEVQLAGGSASVKIRNPLGVIGLTLVTLGIYFFFWWYYINREMRDLGHERGVDLGQKPGNSVWAVTAGALIVVPAIISEWTTAGRIQRSQETVGVERPAIGPVIFLLMLLISPVGLWYAQSELNKVWRIAQGGGGQASIAPTVTMPVPPGEAPPVEARPEVPGQ